MKTTKVTEKINETYQFVPMAFNLSECFFPQKTIVNSWFFIGRVTVEEHELVFLFHLMSGTVMKAGLMNTVVSVLDKTTGFYQAKDTVEKSLKTSRKEGEELCVKTGFAKMQGTLEKEITLEAKLDDCSLAVKVSPVGNIIYNGGTGYFPLLQNKQNYQYSCPEMKMNGTITIENKKYTVKDGDCWFDRQWNTPELKNIMNLKDANQKWMWMGIKLNDGKSISLWEILPADGKHFCFATVLHEDGHQTVCQIPSMVEGATEIWHSDITNQNYPTHWKVEIADLNIMLDVVCDPAHQEIVSQVTTLNKYEAESRVTGTCGEQVVDGVCCVELLGIWE